MKLKDVLATGMKVCSGMENSVNYAPNPNIGMRPNFLVPVVLKIPLMIRCLRLVPGVPAIIHFLTGTFVSNALPKQRIIV